MASQQSSKYKKWLMKMYIRKFLTIIISVQYILKKAALNSECSLDLIINKISEFLLNVILFHRLSIQWLKNHTQENSYLGYFVKINLFPFKNFISFVITLVQAALPFKDTVY
jgi:hypothetical protein